MNDKNTNPFSKHLSKHAYNVFCENKLNATEIDSFWAKVNRALEIADM